jgi:pimeloyl-ACP methyl ester carboxylesterase
VSHQRELQQRIRTADGIELRALLSAPADPAAVLLLCHGLTTDGSEHGAFDAISARAVRVGLAVARFDFRAHGCSGGTNEGLRLEGLRNDADAVMSWTRAELGPTIPVIALGVSFGGGAAIHVAATDPACAGLALWYAVVDYEWNYGSASPVAFTHRMRASRHDGDPYWSAMPVLGTSYHLPAGLLAELPSDRTRTLCTALSVPVLAYFGSRDRFVDVTPLRRIAADNPNVDLRIAYGSAHGFVLWRPWVIRKTVDWAVRVAQPGSAVMRSGRRRRREHAR